MQIVFLSFEKTSLEKTPAGKLVLNSAYYFMFYPKAQYTFTWRILAILRVKASIQDLR